MPVPELRNPDEEIPGAGTVGEFWRWAMSDLLGNTNRGLLAEYLVGKALGGNVLKIPRMEWDCYDLEYGDFRIEVKSSAYVQVWHREGQKPSTPTFSVGVHRCWDARNGTYRPEKRRYAHLYIFCLFPSDRNDQTRDVLEIDKWAFYITTTRHLESQISPTTSSLGLARVRHICGAPVSFSYLKSHVDNLLETI